MQYRLHEDVVPRTIGGKFIVSAVKLGLAPG